MHPMLNIATRAAREAGDIIRRYSDKVENLRIHSKQENDFVTEVDRQAEQTIISALRKAYPDHAILGEESGRQGAGDAEYQWVIDPLDGTTNFLYGVPHYAVSIALKQKGRLLLGVVYDPVKDEMFAAARGDGALMNNRKLRVSQKVGLKNTLLGTGVAFRKDQSLDLSLASMSALLPGTDGVRRLGAASLDLAYVAAGRFDGFWEFGLKEWDVAAGALIVQEAGGLVGDVRGGNTHLQTGDIIAANPKIYREIVKRLHPVLSQ
uniref:Inositol-1-monophosphatase n=1 Tax=uncultured Thiotrichaceae bacterium TaxID=298394 RepID=A0A6S6SXF2_9GAMM|nr:MAG: Inositol-1-monophosphatase (EC [uncultured Thiotrichaceae bacterium]